VFLCFLLKKGENTGWFPFSLLSHIKAQGHGRRLCSIERNNKN
jgi:hypothetical protein